ncbi:hypothetical protein KM043_015402 [Ampulex compressa]|nr:hypothetical protein KM043_015402 [Ampulex compressa]
MKRNSTPSHMPRDDKTKPLRIEDFDISRSRDEEEKQRRRREWQIQKEREKEHERLKQKMILEYEIRRAREQGLEYPKRRCSQHSNSKSRSRSPKIRHRRTSPMTVFKLPVMSEKVESSCGKAPLFKGPEGTKISAAELKKIKVDIHRNISIKTTTNRELQRDIVNPEDVILKRRDGYSFLGMQHWITV